MIRGQRRWSPTTAAEGSQASLQLPHPSFFHEPLKAHAPFIGGSRSGGRCGATRPERVKRGGERVSLGAPPCRLVKNLPHTSSDLFWRLPWLCGHRVWVFRWMSHQFQDDLLMVACLSLLSSMVASTWNQGEPPHAHPTAPSLCNLVIR